MVNFGLLASEIVSLVWGTPGNFNGFRVLSTLLQRRRSTEVNQTCMCVAYVSRGKINKNEVKEKYTVDHVKLECVPMPNLMVALPNIGGALCSTPQSLADAHY